MFVLGIDFGGTKIAVGTANPEGELIASDRIETHAEDGADQAVKRALALGRQLVAETRAGGAGECAAAGAVSPGVVQRSRVLLAPNVPGWDRLALLALLEDAPGLPVAFANDVNGAAVAEARWVALAAIETGLFVSLGTGIKAGIVIAGRASRGVPAARG